MIFNSAIYTGQVLHRRFVPVHHRFCFNLFYLYTDLDELSSIGALTPWWSVSRVAPARFKREDFFSPGEPCLKSAVWARVRAALGEVEEGPVRLLANWRYFGYITNPIAAYYCFDPQERLVAVMCEVTNTPWGERVQYVLPAAGSAGGAQLESSKQMRVSPFSDCRQTYRISCSAPSEQLRLAVQARAGNAPVLDARLRLQRQSISAAALKRMLLNYPLLTATIIGTTYWQAAKLWRKGVPLVGLEKSPGQPQAHSEEEHRL